MKVGERKRERERERESDRQIDYKCSVKRQDAKMLHEKGVKSQVLFSGFHVENFYWHEYLKSEEKLRKLGREGN